MKTLLLSLVLALAVLAQQPPLRVVTCADAGANDTYTCTASPTLGSYVAGQVVLFTPNTANTGAASLNIDSLGAVTIVKLGGAVNTALADNDLRATQRVILQYDGTNFQMLSQTGNAASGGVATQQMGSGGTGSAIAQGQAWYYTHSMNSSTQNFVTTTALRDGTVTKLYVYISGTQPSSQALTCTMLKNGSATSVVATIPASSTEGVFSDTAHSASFTAGDTFVVKCLQAGGASGSALIRYIYWDF